MAYYYDADGVLRRAGAYGTSASATTNLNGNNTVTKTQNTGGSTATQTSAPAYNPNIDYAALMNQAQAAGDTNAYSQYEALRNAKIAGEGLNYNLTYNGNEISKDNPYYATLFGNSTGTTNSDYEAYLKSMQAAEEETKRREAIVAMNDQQALGTQYEEMYKAQLDGLLAQLAAQEGDINKSYDTSAEQAYIASELAKKNMPKILSAMGMSGGMSETAALKQQLNYENNLNSINSERARALNDINTARAQAHSNTNSQIIEAQIENYQRALDAYQSKLSELSGVTSQYNQRALDYQLQQEANLQSNKAQQQQAYMQAMDWENTYKAQQEARAREEEYNAAQWVYDTTGDRSLLDKYYMGEDYKAPVVAQKAPSMAYTPTPQQQAQAPAPTQAPSFIQRAKTSILDTLYRTKSPEEFNSIINRAITSGQMSESEYNAWANS